MADSKDILLRYFDGSLPESFADSNAATKKGLSIAIETRGTHPRYGKIVEIGLVAFEFNSAPLYITKITDRLHQFEDPKEDLPETYTQVTGLDNAALDGQSIDREKVQAMLDEAEFIFAYGAGNVRPFLEKEFEGLKDKVFSCVRNQVEWLSRGNGCRVLRHLAMEQHWYFDSRRADVQSGALVKLLAQSQDEDNAFAELYSRANEPLILIEADAPREEQGLLRKERFVYSRDHGAYIRRMGESTLRKVEASLNSRGFSGHLDEVERLPACERFR